MKGLLYLADGTLFSGRGFGRAGTAVGELVFNTSITGYQEILTDPSYAGQVVTLCYPLIGNYGINPQEMESLKIHARGLVVKSVSDDPSNYMSEQTVSEFMAQLGVVGICGVDTRSITKKIRDGGALKCVISTEELSEVELRARMDAVTLTDAYMDEVSTREVVHVAGHGPRVAVMDYGVKQNIIEHLKRRHCEVAIFPHDTPIETVREFEPDGVLLSNGPGDPKTLGLAIDTVREIVEEFPTFGICLGHQVLALAMGGDTYKMKFGHRGGNHGIYDAEADKAYITAQNHGYAVDRASLEGKMVITHRNLNDETVEGMRHPSRPVFSVQFHPEGAPGPQDTEYLFDKFLKSME